VSLLQVENLRIRFGQAEAVRGVSFSIAAGETLALVGESGSGKSITALSTVRLLPPAASVSGRVLWDGRDMLTAGERDLRRIRGDDISFIFQEPMTSLNPLHTIEKQIGESLALHQGLTGDKARARIVDLLTKVGIRDPEGRLADYPHQLSGGQRQRVMIAMALANGPKLLIADEPTTALDVTIQAQILDLLKQLQREEGLSMLFITHDLGIVRRMADRVCVMQRGEIVEHGETAGLFAAPKHPYTRLLLDSEPRGRPDPIPADAPVVMQGEDVRIWFPVRRGLLRRTVGHIKAVTDVSVAVLAGETVGVVGESGSGKTTLAMGLLRLIRAEGRVVFMGRDIHGLKGRALRPIRRDMQVVFQDPFGSLSPRLSIAQIVAEGLGVHGLRDPDRTERQEVAAALEEVGLDPAAMDRYPHEFSGGQRQRIAIARAIILKPSFVALDEPTSALDMTVQAQIVALLQDIQRKRGLAYLFISHDLKVVRAMAHRVMVMRGGVVVEEGPVERIFEAPQEAYTQELLAAALAGAREKVAVG
jgi:microcin C transport system ATP-binding protein